MYLVGLKNKNFIFLASLYSVCQLALHHPVVMCRLSSECLECLSMPPHICTKYIKHYIHSHETTQCFNIYEKILNRNTNFEFL